MLEVLGKYNSKLIGDLLKKEVIFKYSDSIMAEMRDMGDKFKTGTELLMKYESVRGVCCDSTHK